MKVYWDIGCSRCEAIFELLVDGREQPRSFVGECPTCGPDAPLDRVYVKAPGISFGGVSGATGGSGFYATDYKSSDLVAERAKEHSRKMFGCEPEKYGKRK